MGKSTIASTGSINDRLLPERRARCQCLSGCSCTRATQYIGNFIDAGIETGYGFALLITKIFRLEPDFILTRLGISTYSVYALIIMIPFVGYAEARDNDLETKSIQRRALADAKDSKEDCQVSALEGGQQARVAEANPTTTPSATLAPSSQPFAVSKCSLFFADYSLSGLTGCDIFWTAVHFVTHCIEKAQTPLLIAEFAGVDDAEKPAVPYLTYALIGIYALAISLQKLKNSITANRDDNEEAARMRMAAR